MSIIYIFLCFKQNTAYEMRISDWSSDVCSSDLGVGERQLLAARLAPDMLPLPTQIRFSCGQALQAVTRLGAHGAPDFAEDAMDFAGMQDQIARTLAWLEAMDPAALGGAGDRPAEFALPNGMVFYLSAIDYVRHMALPPFYFS